MKMLSRWRYGLVAGLALVAAIALAACNPPQLKIATAQSAGIVSSLLSDPKTFNYALSNENPNVFTLIYEGLIGESPITGKYEPILAESWSVSPDKKTITFTLRDGLKWSDGQPLTVDDVVFSYNDIYLNPKIPTDIQDVLKIGKDKKFPTVKKVGDRQVAFTTPEPFAPFLGNTGIAILPKHVLAKTVSEKSADGNPLFLSTWGTDTDPKKIVSNGPYQLDEYVSSQRVIFRPNPYYWRKDAQGQSQPYIGRVVWNVVENRNTELLKFRSGDIDDIEPVRPEDFQLLKQEEKRGKFTVYLGGPRPMTTFMAFNLQQGKRNGKPIVDPIKSKWFNNDKFRQAVAYAIDRQKMNINIYRGLGNLLSSNIMPQSEFYLSPEKGGKFYDFNLKKAKQLLLEAGFTYNEQQQLLDTQGNRVEFTLMTNSGNNVREAILAQIKQDLAQIGIQVNPNPVNFNVLIDKLDNAGDWEAYVLGMGGAARDPHGGTNIWDPSASSHNFNQPNQPGKPPIEGRVVADWEAEIGRLYIQASQEMDPQKRKELYFETQRLFQEHLPWIPLVTERIMAAVRDRIQPIEYPQIGEALWNLYSLRAVD
jgi:peptide/nickel transport system substrate-binding protein